MKLHEVFAGPLISPDEFFDVSVPDISGSVHPHISQHALKPFGSAVKFVDSNGHVRIFSWHASDRVVELKEVCATEDLEDAAVRLLFPDPIVPNVVAVICNDSSEGNDKQYLQLICVTAMNVLYRLFVRISPIRSKKSHHTYSVLRKLAQVISAQGSGFEIFYPACPGASASSHGATILGVRTALCNNEPDLQSPISLLFTIGGARAVNVNIGPAAVSGIGSGLSGLGSQKTVSPASCLAPDSHWELKSGSLFSRLVGGMFGRGHSVHDLEIVETAVLNDASVRTAALVVVRSDWSLSVWDSRLQQQIAYADLWSLLGTPRSVRAVLAAESVCVTTMTTQHGYLCCALAGVADATGRVVVFALEGFQQGSPAPVAASGGDGTSGLVVSASYALPRAGRPVLLRVVDGCLIVALELQSGERLPDADDRIVLFWRAAPGAPTAVANHGWMRVDSLRSRNDKLDQGACWEGGARENALGDWLFRDGFFTPNAMAHALDLTDGRSGSHKWSEWDDLRAEAVHFLKKQRVTAASRGVRVGEVDLLCWRGLYERALGAMEDQEMLLCDIVGRNSQQKAQSQEGRALPEISVVRRGFLSYLSPLISQAISADLSFRKSALMQEADRFSALSLAEEPGLETLFDRLVLAGTWPGVAAVEVLGVLRESAESSVDFGRLVSVAEMMTLRSEVDSLLESPPMGSKMDRWQPEMPEDLFSGDATLLGSGESRAPLVGVYCAAQFGSTFSIMTYKRLRAQLLFACFVSKFGSDAVARQAAQLAVEELSPLLRNALVSKTLADMKYRVSSSKAAGVQFSRMSLASRGADVYVGHNLMTVAAGAYIVLPGNMDCDHATAGVRIALALRPEPANVSLANFVMFASALLANDQSLGVLEYCRLVALACSQLSPLTQHFAALAHCQCGMFEKASDCFISVQAAMANNEVATKEDDAAVRYANYASQVMERARQYDLALVSLRYCMSSSNASAVGVRARLMSKIFKFAILLEDFEYAYATMMANQDYSRKINCLRQFVSVLVEKERVDLLVSLPFPALLGEVEKQMLWKARTSPGGLITYGTRVVNMYDVLYLFHLKRKNYSEAAAVAQECSERLGIESEGETLQQQSDYQLMALTALKLSPQDKQFIVLGRDVSMHVARDPSRKRRPSSSPGGTSVSAEQNVTENADVIVVGLSDIEKRYHLLRARLLLRKGPAIARKERESQSAHNLPADDLIYLLANAGFIDAAFSLGSCFEIRLDPVFNAIAKRCVSADQEIELAELRASMAAERGVPTGSSIAKGALGSFMVLEDQIIDDADEDNSAFSVLKYSLDKFDTRKTGFRYHFVAVDKILKHSGRSIVIPSWLLDSFMKRNVHGLLRVLLKHGRLMTAAKMVKEYIQDLPECGAVPRNLVEQLLSMIKLRVEGKIGVTEEEQYFYADLSQRVPSLKIDDIKLQDTEPFKKLLEELRSIFDYT